MNFLGILVVQGLFLIVRAAVICETAWPLFPFLVRTVLQFYLYRPVKCCLSVFVIMFALKEAEIQSQVKGASQGALTV